MSIISDKLKSIKPSITLTVDAKANELRANGYDIISLGVGEPDLNTPENIKIAAHHAIDNNFTKYTAPGGINDLKEAVVKKFINDNQIDYIVNQICISSGAKQVIYNALVASLNPGDEVIIISPYWVSYPEMVKLAGGIPVIVNSDVENDFALYVARIEKAITPKTKWIFINSPNNPCGSVYGYEELRKLADVLLENQHIYVLSDDIYEYLTFDDVKFYTLAQVEPKLKDRVLTVNGVSKSYAMTGWRIGYSGGPEDLIKAMVMVQSQSTSGASSISQKASVEALNGDRSFVDKSKRIFAERRNLVYEMIKEIPLLSCKMPKGAFYFFINCKKTFGKKTPQDKIISNSLELSTYLLEKAHVAVVAGSAFGEIGEGFFRISYATSSEKLKEAFFRIKHALSLLR